MATTQAVLRGFGLLQSIREVDSVQACYARSSHRPIGNRASKCHETLQPLDLSGSVTVAGHTADSQESRPPGAGSSPRSLRHLPCPPLLPYPELVALPFHELQSPTPTGLAASLKRCPLRVLQVLDFSPWLARVWSLSI